MGHAAASWHPGKKNSKQQRVYLYPNFTTSECHVCPTMYGCNLVYASLALNWKAQKARMRHCITRMKTGVRTFPFFLQARTHLFSPYWSTVEVPRPRVGFFLFTAAHNPFHCVFWRKAQKHGFGFSTCCTTRARPKLTLWRKAQQVNLSG